MKCEMHWKKSKEKHWGRKINMFQLIIPGFESMYSVGELHEEIHNPEKAADYFEEKGFLYLEDLVAGDQEDELNPYIPYRIKFPSGTIVDEKELYQKLELPVNFESRKEIVEGFYYFHALHHENINPNRKFSGITFLNEFDKKNAIEKYSKG